MRPFPVVKSGMIRSGKNKKAATDFFILVAGITLAPLLFTTPSFAQAYVSSVPPYGASPYGGSPYGAGMNPTQQAAMQQQQQRQQPAANASGASANARGGASDSAPAPTADLGSATDPNSPAYAVNQLAMQAQQQRAENATFGQQSANNTDIDQQAPPPDVQNLQQINKYQAAMGNSLAADDPVSKGLGVDMRKDAQKEAALSYGARGGLAKRNYQIMERMKGFDTVLDRVFDFRALLIKAPSGLLIEPPIIKESVNAVVVTDNGDEAAVADKVFDINKKAKIVTAPRDWRQYLIQSWSQVPPPPRVLWPKNVKEQADWDTWVAQGWDAGTEQAEQIFEANVNQLTADYNGMVRYKMLLAQDMISAPYAMHEDRGVAGNANQMRVGDRAVRITGPSQFLTRADLWKPANQ